MMKFEDMLRLKKYTTPSVYNGWEQITEQTDLLHCYNKKPTIDYMPEQGSMVGRAVTVKFQPSNKSQFSSEKWLEYRKFVASFKGPKIIVAQDLDQPHSKAAFLGDITAKIHKSLGCVGTIIDGAVRDVEDMSKIGFKVIGKELNVGHGWSCPIEWGVDVTVFGKVVKNGELLHADRHGFLVIEKKEEDKILEATEFMENFEYEYKCGIADLLLDKDTEKNLAFMEELLLKSRNTFQKRI